MLNKKLLEVQATLMYCDTDSVIFYTEGDVELDWLGSDLGEWTNELDHGGYMINTFLSTGPKSYAYDYMGYDKDVQALVPKSSLKCKGVPQSKARILNQNGEYVKRELTVNDMVDMVKDKAIRMQYSSFRKTKDSTIFDQTINKQVRFNSHIFNKRRIVHESNGNITTVPWGY